MSSPKFQIDTAKEFPFLPNAPIVEAVIHWQSAASVDFDPANLESDLAARFSEYQLHTQQNFSAAVSDAQQGMSIQHSWDGFRLTKTESEEPVFVCQFKPSGLVFSRLAPYLGWTNFLEEGIRFWTTFTEIAKPAEIARLSTRFISQIPVKNPADVAEYTEIGEQSWNPDGSSTSGFFIQEHVTLDEHPYIITITRALQPVAPGIQAGLNLIVDIGVSTTDAVAPFDSVDRRLKELRYIKNEVFFGLMKDAAIKFGKDAN